MAVRIVFMGSPTFSLPTLEKLSKNYNLAGVVTQPDRPAGRGRSLMPPPVKLKALELGIPFIQPIKLKDPGVFETLAGWQPDLIVVAAYGQILRQNVLDLPSAGCLNVHASLLPRWRGASPIQFAILAGDPETGVTIMKMDAGMDTGPVLAQVKTRLTSGNTAGELNGRLSEMGADLLTAVLPAYLAGDLLPVPQDNDRAEYARLLKKEDGLLDYNLPAENLERQVRAFNPWPGAYIIWQNQPLKVHAAHTASPVKKMEPGRRIVHARLPAVYTASDLLVLDQVQTAGKKAMPGAVFLNGAAGWL